MPARMILAAGRSPLTLVEGIHWVLQDPDVLERNRCFMTIGSRLRKANGSYDARTPATAGSATAPAGTGATARTHPRSAGAGGATGTRGSGSPALRADSLD